MKFSSTATFILLFCLSSFSLFAQKKASNAAPDDLAILHELEDTLAILGYAVVNDSAEVNRFAACQTLIPTLVKALKIDNSFSYPFDRLKTVSITAPADSSFRIFTWQLFVNDSTYRYYGAIQFNQSKLKLIPLIDRSFEIPNPEQSLLSSKEWYGSLYYGVKKVETPKETFYLLFGYDAYSFFDKRKIIDVLSLDKDGNAVFGKPLFQKEASQMEAGPTITYRLMLEYLSGTNIKCNWDEHLDMVVYDHLIPMPNPYGRGLTHVSDGSYEGYKITKDGLEYVEKVFDHVYDEAPSHEPILEKRNGKDILGRKRSN